MTAENKYVPVFTVGKLKRLALLGREFFIVLNYGVKSSKFITYDLENDRFFVLNYIDNSEQIIPAKSINDSSITNIGEAIAKKAFYTERNRNGRKRIDKTGSKTVCKGRKGVLANS